MNDSQAMQVVHSGHDLADEFLDLSLVQSLALGDVVHEISAGAVLRDEVVAVLRLQDLHQLHDVLVTYLLQQTTLATQVFADVGVRFGALFVNHFDCHLVKRTKQGCTVLILSLRVWQWCVNLGGKI